jgi:peptidoglycan/LPS O-acetylase OafA/YrhL
VSRILNLSKIIGAGWRELTHRPPSQVPALDALRAFAVFGVIGAHYAGSQWMLAKGPETSLAHNPVFTFGWAGVDLFFVLSGLLIGKQLWRELDKTGTVRIPRFLMRRSFRIWPLYFAMMLFVVFVRGVRFQWPDWVFLSNYFPTIYGRSWSLSTEEQFYIIVPFLLLMLIRLLPRGKEWVPLVALLFIVPVIRHFDRARLVASGMSSELLSERMVFPIHVHCEGLAVGLLLAWLTTRKKHLFEPKGRGGMSPFALGVFFVCTAIGGVLDVYNREDFAFLALALIFGSATFLALADRSFVTAPLRSKFFYPFSRLAFGMYLNHFWFFHGSTRWVVKNVGGMIHSPTLVFLIGLVVGTLISAGVSAVTFMLIEHPFLMLREHWFGQPRTPVAPAVQVPPAAGAVPDTSPVAI